MGTKCPKLGSTSFETLGARDDPCSPKGVYGDRDSSSSCHTD